MKLAYIFVVAGLSFVACDVYGNSACQSRTLSITVDNSMELYIEGVKINCLPNHNNWQLADAVTLPCAARVIAVKGVDYGVIAGILASTDDGSLLTDSSWKCTNQHFSGWETVEFDDSQWPAAHQVAIHETLPWKIVPGIRTNAYWIWTRNYVNGDWTVYCRKDLIKRCSCD